VKAVQIVISKGDGKPILSDAKPVGVALDQSTEFTKTAVSSGMTLFRRDILICVLDRVIHAWWSWLRSLGHNRLRGQGQVQDEFAVVLVKPYLVLRVRAAGELAWAAIVETPATVADPDLADAGPLPGQPGPHRDA